jgi:hypothetical protein
LEDASEITRQTGRLHKLLLANDFAGRLDMTLRFNGQVYLCEFQVVELTVRVSRQNGSGKYGTDPEV